MSNLLEWAKKELDLLNKNGDGMQEMMNQNILDILKVFCEQGHTGFTASYLISALTRLMKWKPLTPLTGADDEWRRRDSTSEQNIRCSAVFRDIGDNGTAYYIHGKVFSDNGGITWYENKDSFIPVTFPFTVPNDPERVYIEYLEDVPPGYTSDRYEIITDDPDRIKALYEQKRKEFDEVQREED